MLDGQIGTLHFDEAWLPTRHSIDSTKTCMPSGRTTSTERVDDFCDSLNPQTFGRDLSSVTDLVREPENKKLDKHTFNEAYLMHSSTSPQYAIIASCDVAAAMMEPPGGTALVEESIMEAIEFRRAMRKVDEDGALIGGSRFGDRNN